MHQNTISWFIIQNHFLIRYRGTFFFCPCSNSFHVNLQILTALKLVGFKGFMLYMVCLKSKCTDFPMYELVA